MTKSEITIKINSIPVEMLSTAAYVIQRMNPMNAFTRNRTYVTRKIRYGFLEEIKIDFQTRFKLPYMVTMKFKRYTATAKKKLKLN